MARKSRKNIPATEETAIDSSSYNAAAYIRLSVEDNKKRGDSVESQKSIIQNYIAVNPDIRLHGYYIDNGTTGTNFDRPSFRQMLSDAEKGVINCIIVKDLSRFGRNVIDTGYYIEKFLPSLKVRFIAVTDDYDSSAENPGDGIILPLKNMINEAYALDIGRKIKAQQRQAMQSGEYVGARPPYGYLKHPDNCHRLIIDPESAPIVKQIFQWAYDKAALNDIVRRLNEAEIEPPNIYSQRKGIINFRNIRSNHYWQTFSVNRILMEEAYTGDLVQGKKQSINHKQIETPPDEWIIVRGTHEPIISRDMFEAVKAYRNQVAEESKTHPVTHYTPNIFKGKIYCGHCGFPLHRQKCSRRKGKPVYVYHCLSNSRKARGSCESYSIRQELLIDTLLTFIQKHAEIMIGMSIKMRGMMLEAEIKSASAKSEIASLRQKIDRNSQILKSLYENLVTGIITKNEYHEMRTAYEEKIEGMRALAAELDHKRNDFLAKASDYIEVSDMVSKVKSSDDITAELVDMLVERISVFSDRSIEVNFRFNSGLEPFCEALAL